ncbi:hypothetical protein BOTBODRAFT_28363 [Botryobasidium botryosum FD-172 SS1]|uniref:NAD-dependent epimerase/dehydratase domain-containing protein n=1 Tax=Botryobasidium botryosum (strain FD-172 SS1) TaxID=930990 RepID=A0A067MW20_BOTB1|nr:hypothetical protein BOTBODRAFT_28363 [Botryobasidium botryosum FD-172 SS1]
MPAIQSPAKVLVTGASGYVASWIVKVLLERGYSVRGTVRSASKGESLKNTFKDHGENFSYVLVEDMTIDGAYNDAVKGVDAIAHTASPVVLNARDPYDLINPAVSGTVNILKSAKQYGPTVKRVVITSSCATIFQPKKGNPPIYTEEDWNEVAVKEVETKGVDADQPQKYRASKVLAERSAWKWAEENKDVVVFDVTTILPSFVLGPILTEVASPSQLNASPQRFYDAVKTEKPADALTSFVASVVDVRDVALAHVRALEVEEAGGQRFIVTKTSFSWQLIYDTLQQDRKSYISYFVE